MNYLQQYIELKCQTCRDIARATGYGYHCIHKTVRGDRRNHAIRTAIAEHLGLDPAKTWGRGSVIYLRRMVAVEANRVAQERAEITRREILSKYGASADNLTAKRKIVNV